MMNAIAVILVNETGSLKKIIPKIVVPAAPIPVQTAYAVPIGKVFNDQANSEKLPDAKTKNPMLGQIFVKLLESLSIVAKPTSSIPAVITAIQAIYSLSMYNLLMTFSDLNLMGVIVAFLFSFASGAIWFGPKTFYPIWMKEKGNASGQLTASQNKPVLLFGGTILGLLIQTLTLALIINSLGKSIDIGVVDGAGIGFALGIGISMFSSLSHRLFSGETLKVWIIETANDGLNLTIAGAIIAFFN